MHRELSPEAARAILARESSESFLVLMQITGPGLDPIRVINNTDAVTRNGEVYEPWSFDGDPPEDGAQPSQTVPLTVDNMDREVTDRLRNYQGVPSCEIMWVMASQPDRAVYGPFEFVIKLALADEMTIELQLGHEEDILNQGWPGQLYGPTNSPGLYV